LSLSQRRRRSGSRRQVRNRKGTRSVKGYLDRFQVRDAADSPISFVTESLSQVAFCSNAVCISPILHTLTTPSIFCRGQRRDNLLCYMLSNFHFPFAGGTHVTVSYLLRYYSPCGSLWFRFVSSSSPEGQFTTLILPSNTVLYQQLQEMSLVIHLLRLSLTR
jgi:hypothetical protein